MTAPRCRCAPAANGAVVASVPIQKDGMYHIAAVENGEDVRLSEDYFIEAQKDQPPEIKISRPGRDYRASPIEEVTVGVDAKDDFGLKEVTLHYSVNGGPEKAVPMLHAAGAKTSSDSAVLSLEDFKVQPGDIVSLYATAKDARTDRQHRYLLHRGAAVRTQLHPVAAGRRRRRRRRRCRAAGPDLAAAEGNHHRHLESDQGPRAPPAPTRKTPRSWPPSRPSCATRPNRWPIACGPASWKAPAIPSRASWTTWNRPSQAMGPAARQAEDRQVAGRPGPRAESAAIPDARGGHVPRYPGGLRAAERRRRGRRQRRHARHGRPFRSGAGHREEPVREAPARLSPPMRASSRSTMRSQKLQAARQAPAGARRAAAQGPADLPAALAAGNAAPRGGTAPAADAAAGAGRPVEPQWPAAGTTGSKDSRASSRGNRDSKDSRGSPDNKAARWASPGSRARSRASRALSRISRASSRAPASRISSRAATAS